MRRLPILLACALAAAAATTVAPHAARAQAGDWGVQRDPFDKSVVARYKALLGKNPHDAGALAKLLELYRRYRTVDLLKEEYQKAVDSKPTDWSALVVLGRMYKQTGDDPRALGLFTRAVAASAADAPTWLLIGEVQKAANKPTEARAAYDQALANATSKDMKKAALRSLADLALAAGDIDGANGYFQKFLDLDPKNAQLWIERGDAMLAAGKQQVALESYAAAEKLLGGDPSKRMEVVSRRGQAFEAMQKDDEAVAEYRRAIKLAPKGYYLEVELTGRIVDIYRRKQALPALLAQSEKEWPEATRGHFEWSTLGKLYEETGAQDKAIAALKKAVAKSPWELDTQRRLITLLENSGKDAEAIAQYEAVVRAAPGEPRFQLDLADRYQRRGDEKKALDLLVKLKGRFPTDAGVLSAVADLYQRWGKEDLAIAEYEKLAKIEPDDPSHLITLGEQYLQKGDATRAMATWKRLTASGKASGFAKLGEVMAEHNKPVDALANYDKAIKLEEKNPEHYKGRASVYESQKRWSDAVADWEQVLALTGSKATDRLARRDARLRIVKAITKGGVRERQYVDKWTAGFKGGDNESGYFLYAYYQIRPKAGIGATDLGEPTTTITALHERVPEDNDLTLELVKAYRDTRRYPEAVALLQAFAIAQPSREREVYQMISEIKTLERKDDEAIEWAQKALAKNPSAPDAHERLAERYVEMQRFDEAITAYEAVLALDPRNTKSQFALAQLYVQTGKPQRAAEILRDILRTSTNEDIIGRAGRDAIVLEEMTFSLGELEKVLSPLSFIMAHKPVFRHVLVDLYLRYVPWLVDRERHGTAEVRTSAQAELARIGGHGLQPLLEALRDEKDPTQQRVAVAVLGHLGNKGAAAPLVHMAKQEPPKDTRRIGTLQESIDREVRVDALVAAGRLGDPKVLDDVLPLVDHDEVSMREAAVFTIGRTADRRAVPALVRSATGDRQASVRTLACLGLAQVDDPRVGPAAIAVLADARREDATRAACAYAIGARGIRAGVPALLAALADNRGEAQRLAAWSLGQLAEPKALGPLVRAYFARAGRSNDELVWAIARVSGAAGVAASRPGPLSDYPLNRARYDNIAAIAAFPGELPHVAASPQLVIDHATDIAAGILDALGEHRDVVVSVLADLDSAPSSLALGALTPAGAPDARTATALATIGERIAPVIAAQQASDDPKLRALAVSITAKLDPRGNAADAAVTTALADAEEPVRAAGMRAIVVLAVRRGAPPPLLVGALTTALASPSWADRRSAALALGQLLPGGDPAALTAAASDPRAFVREAVGSAPLPGAAGLSALLALSHDDIPQVRAAAARTLGTVSDPRAAQRRAELTRDPDPVVRRAAGGS